MTLLQLVSNHTILKHSLNSVTAGKNDDARKAIRGIDGLSINSFENSGFSIVELSERLLSGSYNFSPSKAFFFRKNSKKEYRLIAPPSIEDAIVQHSILTVLKPIFGNILNNGVSYCGIPKEKKHKINHKTALLNLHQAFCEGNYHVYKSDINSFFNTIKKDILLNRLCSFLPDHTIDNLLHDTIYFKIGNYEQLVSEKKGLVPGDESEEGIAQGSPLSPFLSNIYLSEADSIVRDTIQGKYFRYVDDFLIATKSEQELKQAATLIEKLFLDLNLSLSKEKTESIYIKDKSKSVIFLGLKISKYEVEQKKPISEVVRNTEQNLFKVRTLKKRKKASGIDDINNRIQGYAMYYSSFHTMPMLHALNKCLAQRRKLSPFKGLKVVDESGKRQFMSKEKWQSAFQW